MLLLEKLSLVYGKKIHSLIFYGLIGGFGLGDHEFAHEKYLQWTIEGLEIDFPKILTFPFGEIDA